MTEIASDDKQHPDGASLVVRLSLLRIDPCKTNLGKLGLFRKNPTNVWINV